MKTKAILLSSIIFLTSSCGVIDSLKPDGKLGGTQSVMGEVGNTFSIYGLKGITPQLVEVTELNDGVSTVKAKVKVTDTKFKEMAKSIPFTNNWNGDIVEVILKGRITDEGIQSVFSDGNLTLVKFDAKVGDTYSAKINGNTIKRKVITRTDKDDYPFVFFNIKVIEVEETGTGIPGLSKILYYTNHKFGIVGIKAIFEDGSFEKMELVSKN